MTAANVLLSLVIGISVFADCHRRRIWLSGTFQPVRLDVGVLAPWLAFAAAPTAATKRDMQFQPLALRTIHSLFVRGIVGLVLTLAGAAVWALVWQAIITRLVASIVLWYTVPSFLGCDSRAPLSGNWPIFSSNLSRGFLTWSCNQIPRVM